MWSGTVAYRDVFWECYACMQYNGMVQGRSEVIVQRECWVKLMKFSISGAMTDVVWHLVNLNFIPHLSNVHRYMTLSFCYFYHGVIIRAHCRLNTIWQQKLKWFQLCKCLDVIIFRYLWEIQWSFDRPLLMDHKTTIFSNTLMTLLATNCLPMVCICLFFD